ncbi:MAG TPA: AgmX/PglI C-terminal domain-containing protein [Steroidobacteraceae bacterium]|nr:AgmX/PglI C-terminal domain-containing protein [Steroidobacteraceae bacterium]
MTAQTAKDPVAKQSAAEEPRTPHDPASEHGASRDQEALLAHLGTSQESVDALVDELRALDGQLEALAGERHQHRLLHQVCDALGELGKLGAAQLFWGTRDAAAAGEGQLGRVRARVTAFESRIGELEARRQGIREQINQAQYQVGLIEDELFEAQEEEERRQQEWIVEREISGLHARPLLMPWIWGGEDDRRFQKSLLSTLACCLLLALIITLIRLPFVQPPEEAQAEQVLHITMAQLPRPPPPPPRLPPPKPQAQKPVEKPTPQLAQRPPTEEPVKPAVETPEPPKPAGLMVFKQQLAALAQSQADPALGAQARINNADNSVGRPERAMLTSSAPGSSGGINLAAVSRGLGPGGGSERNAIRGGALTRASSGIGTGAAASRPVSGGPGPGRTDEEIQIVFDRHKSQLYRLYNLELRRDPTLQGKIILRLTIEPDGSVSMCMLHGSNMNAPELATQVVERVKAFNFGAKVVPPVTIIYPIDFLPAA